MAALPKTRSGKILRKTMREIADGVRVQISRDTEETISALRRGDEADLARPEIGYTELMHDLGLIRPFDGLLLPNLADVPAPIVARGAIDGAQFNVPVDWGYVVPLYRTDRVEPRRDSYDLLFDERYSGRIAWFDTSWMLVIAGYVLGAGEPWDMDDDEIADAAALLTDRIRLIHGFWSAPEELDRNIASGDVVVAYAWNISFLAARRAGLAVDFVTRPAEGAIVWTEGFVLGARTRNFFAAHRFVDGWLSRATARRLTSLTAMGHTTFEVDPDGVDPTLRSVLRLDDPEALLGPGVHLDRNIPRRRVYEEAWERVKAR